MPAKPCKIQFAWLGWPITARFILAPAISVIAAQRAAADGRRVEFAMRIKGERLDKMRRYLDKTAELSILAMTIIIPVLFYTRTNDVFEINKMFVFRFFTVLGVCVWIVTAIREKRAVLFRTDLDFPVIGLLAVTFINTFVTNNFIVSVFGVYEDYEGIITAINYFFFYYLLVNYMGRKNLVNKTVTMILISSGVISAYGLAQNFGWDFVKWNPDTYSPDRFFSTLGNPNFLAAYIVEAIPVLVILFFITHESRKKFIFLGVLLAAVVVVFLTKSRAGFISLLVTLLLVAVYSFIDARNKENELFSKNKKWFIAFAVLLLLTAFIPLVRDAFAMLWERSKNLFSMKGIILTPRVYIWKSALMMFKDFPVLGTGLDTFQVMFPYYRFPIYWQLEWNGTPEKTHNVFLQVLATQGLAGFGFYALLFIVFLKKSFNIIFSGTDMHKRYLVFGFFMCAVAYYIQGLFNYTVVAYGALYWTALAVIFTLDASGRKAVVYNFSGGLKAFLDNNRAIAVTAVAVIATAACVMLARYWAGDMYFKVANIAVSTNQDEYSPYYYQKSVELAPGREIYWVKYGIGFEKLMRKEPDMQKKQQYINQALKIHESTIKMNDRNGYNYNNAARVYKYYGEAFNDRSKFELAIKYYTEAVKRDTNNAYFGLDLATVYINLQDWQKAEALCLKYAGLYPEYAVPLSYLGYINMLQGPGRINEARNYYEQAVSKQQWHNDYSTKASTYSNLAIIYFNLKMVNEAAAMFTEVVKIRPDYLDGYLNLGKLYELMKNKLKAVEMYEQANRINPEDNRATQALKSLGVMK